jgi:O-antigen ligase
MLIFLKRFKFLYFAYFILSLAILGEMYRLPVISSQGILLTDIFIPLLIIGAFSYKLAKKPFHDLFKHPKSFRYLVVFITIAFLSLLLSIPNFSTGELLNAFMYWIRFTTYSLFGLLVYQEVKKQGDILNLLLVMLGLSSLLAFLGFAQMIVFPDLAFLVEEGWDPHQNRLVSTWLDPNFVGGFLSFALCIVLSFILHLKKGRNKSILIASALVLEFAIFLTYSRSAYLAFLIGTFVVTIFKSPKVYLLILLIFGLQMSSSSYAVQRVFSMIFNLDMIFSAESKDPTANFRVRSWLDTISLSSEKPILGHGYNNLATVKNQRDLVHTESQHSASGSDSSLLTILATTGILGFIPFFLFYLTFYIEAWKRYFSDSKSILEKSLNLGILGAIAGLFVHSIFVNSLLYPPVLIFFFVTWAIQNNLKSLASSQSS